MSESRSRIKRLKAHRGIRWAAFALLVLVIASAGAFAYAQTPADHIAKGVSAGSVDLSDKTREEAERLIDRRFAALRIEYSIPGAKADIAPGATPEDGSAPIAKIDSADVVARAFEVGRGSDAISPVAERLFALTVGSRIPLSYSFDGNALRAALDKAFMGKTDPATDAKMSIRFTGNEPVITVISEKDGWAIDFDAVARMTDSRIAKLDDSPIKIAVRKDVPAVHAQDAESFIPAVTRAIGRAPLSLTIKGESWTVSKSLLADWLVITGDGGPVRPALDKAKAGEYLESRGAKFAVAATDAAFEEKDGKVTKFVPAVDGEKVDVQGTIDRIESALFGSEDKLASSVAVAMAVAPPKISTEAANPYGIKEVIGVGATNFMGSPKNRLHNIAVGAAAVHGSLIAPGAEFSMIKTLGAIDASTGYLEELVIKENKTTPEYGGGLCQIGSTAFRAVLDSGLPVTARQNHSYRVPYYERDGDGNNIGPGKDATIYDPSPDFKFMNDTGHYIVIQTAISGNKLTFTFWGVRDGRKSEQTAARVYNVVPPPEKKEIESVDIPAGSEKCTEHAHPGSDAVFTYTVTSPDGTVKTKDFVSHYKPWQEVCLKGVTQAELDAAKAAGKIGDDGAVIPESADAAGVTGAPVSN